jgi:hypothetical protein
VTWQTLTSLLAAFGLGGILTNVVSGAPERRRARAEARTAALVVERLRMGTDDVAEWRAAVRAVIGACLTARVPRGLADRYAHALRASWALSRDRSKTSIPFANFLLIDYDTSSYLRSVGELLVDYLWHPTRTRLTLRRRLSALDREKARLIALAETEDSKGEKHDAHVLSGRYWDV